MLVSFQPGVDELRTDIISITSSPVAKLIPPWAHLQWTEETTFKSPMEVLPEVCRCHSRQRSEWIYRSHEVNRIDVVRIRNISLESDAAEIEWMTPLMDSRVR